VRVLVTGASGMLGGAVALQFAGRGDDVVVLQRRPSGLAGVSEVLGDVTDPKAVRAAASGADAVVHLAAKVSVTGPWHEFEAVNIGGTRTLLDEARAAGVDRFVYVSSPSVAHVGRALVGAGNDPADPIRARGHYARSKAAAESLALAADRPDLAVVAIRPHLVWGPGDTQFVPRIVQRARSGRLALIDHGAALIDTTYVTNAADAIVAAVDRAPVAHGQALVVSNGQPRTVAELVTRICRAAGAPPPRLRVPYPVAAAGGGAVEFVWSALRRTDDPPMTRFLAEQLATAHWFDQRRTREVLQWTPKIGLDRGFELLAATSNPESATPNH
jgi:nucleoside-diphosphate-sugar epimerase